MRVSGARLAAQLCWVSENGGCARTNAPLRKGRGAFVRAHPPFSPAAKAAANLSPMSQGTLQSATAETFLAPCSPCLPVMVLATEADLR